MPHTTTSCEIREKKKANGGQKRSETKRRGKRPVFSTKQEETDGSRTSLSFWLNAEDDKKAKGEIERAECCAVQGRMKTPILVVRILAARYDLRNKNLRLPPPIRGDVYELISFTEFQ